jgi:hypothetical protein
VYELKESRVGLNKQVSIEFILETTSVGACTINISRKSTKGASTYQPYKSLVTGAGRITVDLGIISTISDYTYRITATDGLGKIAKTPWYLSGTDK